MDEETIPLQGPPDGWPRTKDGWLVRPGMRLQHADFVGIIRNIYRKGLKTYSVELETPGGCFKRVELRSTERYDPALHIPSPTPPPPPLQVDMAKVAKAANRLHPKPKPKLDLEKALKVGRALLGSSIPETEQIRPPAPPPADGGRRTHTTKVRKGCSGFNHPNFHP